MDKKLLEALALELKKHPENGNITLRELVEGVVKNTEGKVDEVLDKVETSEIPEYYFFKSGFAKGLKIEISNNSYTLNVANKEGMTLNAYELQDMLKDYNKTFPDWREDDGKKTPKNPIGLNSKFGYWGSGSYDGHDNTSLVVNVNDGVTRQSADKRFPAVYYTSIIG